MKLYMDLLEYILKVGFSSKILLYQDIIVLRKIPLFDKIWRLNEEYFLKVILKKYNFIKKMRQRKYMYRTNIDCITYLDLNDNELHYDTLQNLVSLSHSNLPYQFEQNDPNDSYLESWSKSKPGELYEQSSLRVYNSDLVSDIIIWGKDIRLVEVYFGDTQVFRQHFISAGLISITPFEFGIPNFSFVHSNPYIRIYSGVKGIEGIKGSIESKIYIKSYWLPFRFRRNLCEVTINDGNNGYPYEFKHIYYDKSTKTLKNTLSFGYGMCWFKKEP